MVLQDLDPSSDSFNDNPYPSENDSYARSPPSGNRYDASSLPQPIPILAPFLGFSEAAVRFKTESTLQFAEQKVHRALYPEESQALAHHLYQLEQRKSYFSAIGAGLGTWRWYNTMSRNRYPLYQPKPETINPHKFWFIRGPNAVYARHSWRLFLYVFAALELGKLTGQLVAQPLAAQNTQRDPKLAQFAVDLRGAISADQSRARQGRAQMEREWEERVARDRAARSGGASMPEGQRRRSWSEQRSAAGSDDDMSPTAGNEPWASSTGDAWADSAFTSDSSTQDTPQRRQPSSPPTGSRPQRPAQTYDDDASPTGGLFQDEVQSQSRPGESAWDRLRRGGAPPPAQRRPEPAYPEQREGSTLGDGFTFAGSDDERKRAQERAQREFDARIERERQGKDFNSDEKKW